MNWYFYRVWLPLQLLTGFVLVEAFYYDRIHIHWWAVAISFFLIGPVGIGVGYHRLFSHRSFSTWRPVELILATLGTLAAYAPVLFWASVHQQHHRISDTKEDPSSPEHHGFWESFWTYRMRKSILQQVHIRNYCVKQILRDRSLVFLSRHFTKINWTVAIALGLWDLNWLASLYVLPVLIEHLRINLVSSLSHLPVPLSYQNHATEDRSQNNLILGLLSFGFGWHNNHHHDARALSLHEKWWEIDIEGLIARFLTKA